eukprot:TRINITY_DN40682_c0_g1_i1.p1 TRINITY_DN40682_c0_g1~~TRINITY_DN40682_c0_g1_i1.p1  ORF type:complete len:312 (+),score=42.53 TRINITY_DN40682_c0_g1_i1:154-1089(+)
MHYILQVARSSPDVARAGEQIGEALVAAVLKPASSVEALFKLPDASLGNIGRNVDASSDIDTHCRMTELLLLILTMLLLFAAVVYVWQQRTLGKYVQAYIEEIDKDIIGVDLTMDALWLSLAGTVNIKKLIIHNPVGYQSDHLVSIDHVSVTFDMFQLIKSKGMNVVLKRVMFSNVGVNLELGLRTSNVNEMARFQTYGYGDVELPPSGRTYSIHQVLISGIQVNMIPFGAFGGTTSVRVPIGDVSYKDFAKEVDRYDIPKLLLHGLMAEVLGDYNIKRKSESFSNDDDDVPLPIFEKDVCKKKHGTCTVG